MYKTYEKIGITLVNYMLKKSIINNNIIINVFYMILCDIVTLMYTYVHTMNML